MPEPQFEVRVTEHKGRGLFTRTPIRAGERVIALEGKLLTTAELTDDLLALQVGPDLWLCSPGGALDDYSNHSCDPNCGFLQGVPVLYALRDIAAGEEICWDYSTSIAEAGWSLDCRCGSAKCRGVVQSWGELAPEERERLRGRALDYLRAI